MRRNEQDAATDDANAQQQEQRVPAQELCLFDASRTAWCERASLRVSSRKCRG
jgi:hypothetical protein